MSRPVCKNVNCSATGDDVEQTGYCSDLCRLRAQDKDRKCTCGYPAHACTGDNSPHYARMREIDNHSNDNECGIFSDYTGD